MLSLLRCFWINLPFGALGILIVMLVFKNPHRQQTKMTFMQRFKEMDPLGALFLIGAIVCLLLALQWGGLERSWTSSTVWGCLLGFVLLLTVFVLIQRRMGEKATIPGRVLKQRSIMAVALTLFFMSMGMYTYVSLLRCLFTLTKIDMCFSFPFTFKQSEDTAPSNPASEPFHLWCPTPLDRSL
jgi:hypothetical protein